MIEIMLAYIFRKLNNPGDGSGDGDGSGGGSGIGTEVFEKLLDSGGALNDYFGYSVAVSKDGSTIVVGAYGDDDKGADSGSAYIFTKQANGSYLGAQKLVASDGAAGDNFGRNVAVSGDGFTIIVGAYLDDNEKGGNSGSAYVFTKQTNGSYLQTQKLLASDGAAGDHFGISVTISENGSTIVVGAYGDDDNGSNSGSVYVFTKQTNGSYVQIPKLLASDGVDGDYFGISVSISGDGSTFVVGAYASDDKGIFSGSAYIFTKQANGSYLQTQKLLASDGSESSWFGHSVAISGDGSTVVIGAYFDDNTKGADAGSAYIFTKQTNGSYLQTQKLVASVGEAGDYFGFSVAVSPDGSTVVIGGYGDDDKGTGSGSTYVFIKQTDGSYVQTHKLLAGDGTVNSHFGFSVAASNTSVVIGAPYHLNKGAAYIFGKLNDPDDGSGDEPELEIDPGGFKILFASDRANGDSFGTSVAVSTDGLILVVGAPMDDNEKGIDAGSAYIFTKQTNGKYLQIQKLVSSDGVDGGRFGHSVDITGDGSTVVVGAFGNNDKGIRKGVAYVFTKQPDGSYLQTQRLVAFDGADGDVFGWSVAVSADGTTIVVGANYDSDKGSWSGSAYIFTKQANGSYLETQKLLASDGVAKDMFGTSVAVSADGSNIVVGAPLDDDDGNNSGSAYIFTKQANGSYLETQKLIADDGVAEDIFGQVVAISADSTTIVVSAPWADDKGDGSGSVYIFTKEVDGSYFETHKLLALDGRGGDQFGKSVAVSRDGSTVVVGAPERDTNIVNFGVAYVFTKQPDRSYLQIHKLASTGSVSNNHFGLGVAISNTSVAVSAQSEGFRGVVYVY